MSKPKYSLYMRVHFLQELMVLNFNVFRKNWSVTQCNFIFSLGCLWSKLACKFQSVLKKVSYPCVVFILGSQFFFLFLLYNEAF